MIYLDNSATSSPKPDSVTEAVAKAMRLYAYNPGRGGYKRSIDTAQAVYQARSAVSRFFNTRGEEQVIFTGGCTQSLNMVIKGILQPGDHVLISSLEHNAVVRPLEKLKNDGIITYSIVPIDRDDDVTIQRFREAINSHTRMLICTHASNVFGTVLPVERLCALAHSYGMLFCLDAAQSGGVLPLNMEEAHFDYVCCAGHKGLHGPMGIGLLLLGDAAPPDTLIEGGTGSESASPDMPTYLPDRFESGTLNIPGILGLQAGIRFVEQHDMRTIYRREMKQLIYLYDRLSQLDRIELYSDRPVLGRSAPVLSFGVKEVSSEVVSEYLGRYNIATRAGLHCAPLAHRQMNTLQNGTVRISPSYRTSRQDMDAVVKVLNKFLKSH